ncbi:MAG: ribonuclease E activity regulator RraA [Pseudomonadota bacterium]
MKTADLMDAHPHDLTLVHLPFRRFGAKTTLTGPVQTVSCFEDNSVVRAQLETPGEGRVLVVDGGGSTRVALLGDILADLAITHGWAGIVLNAAIRDSAEIDTMPIAVFALGTSPVKSFKRGWGIAGVDLTVGNAPIKPGYVIYGDGDGVLVSAKHLL